MRRKKKSVGLAYLLTFCMLFGLLPADMLGGIASVEAAEAAAAENVTYSAGDWSVSGGDSGYLYRTSTWNFTDKYPDSEKTVAVGDSLKGITVLQDAVSCLPQGLSVGAGDSGAIGLPLDGDTDLVTATFALTSNSSSRYFAIGDGETAKKIYHKADEKTEADDAIDSSKMYTGTFDAAYFKGGQLKVSAYNGETKFGQITLTERKPAGDSGGSGDQPVVTQKVWRFNGGDGAFTGQFEGNRGSFDGLEIDATNGKFAARTTDTQVAAGTKVAIPVTGPGKVTIATYPGYHNYTINYLKDGTPASVKADSDSFTLEYDAGNTSLEFVADEQLYLLTIIREDVSAAPEPPAVVQVKAVVTVEDSEGLLGGAKMTLVNESDDSDTHEIAAKGCELMLKANSTYRIVTDHGDLKLTVNGGEKITTADTELQITVKVESAVVNPVVTVEDDDKVLGTLELTLTNKADEKDTHILKDGQAVKLLIGASYILACTDSAITATIEGGKSFTVKGDEKTLTVRVGRADTTGHTYDVWDFGAEQLAGTDRITYNNKLNEDIINSWYPGVAPGTAGVTIPGNLVVKDAEGNDELIFNIGGEKNQNKHRYRTANQNLTRYDGKSLKNVDDGSIVYKGYIYSNASSTPDVSLQVALKAGDIVTYAVSNNNTASNLTFRAPSGSEEVKTYAGSSGQAMEMTFYAAETGMYSLYSANEKLVVARVLRERPAEVTVSGKVTAPAAADLQNAELVFTNETNGVKTRVSPQDGSYSVKLQEQYSYTVALEGVNGYIVGKTNSLTLKNEAGNTSFDVEIVAVELLKVTGSLADLTPQAAGKLSLTLSSDKVYIPKITVNAQNQTYETRLEKGVTYQVEAEGVNDYSLETTTLKADQDTAIPITFTKKPVYVVNVKLEGPAQGQGADAALTFTNIGEEGYVYSFQGTEGIALRDGQYKVMAELDGYTQAPTADVKINGASVDKTIVMVRNDKDQIPFKAVLTVGANKDYQTINEALEAVRCMADRGEKRVTIAIDPGNYEEMLVIDVDNVTLANASPSPSLDLKDKGVNIADDAVRITSYYGHGYTYYSMGEDCKYDEALLEANKENGYPSFENPGSGTTAGSYWNATVVVGADGFQACGIIFENSFNQYVSEKAFRDVIVKQSGAKEGSVSRADLKAGDTTVQGKAYVERAAALALKNNVLDTVFEECKFVGRQDTLYGGKGTYAEFIKCSVYGGTDYIFGGMTAIFDTCDLVFNTSDDKNDVGYITAAQQTAGRGYLMFNCHVTSTEPGVDTASQYPSKPGYFGRPWQTDTSEVVFFKTTIDAAHEHWVDAESSVSKTNGKSLIAAPGWDSSLSGESTGMYEYGTIEKSGVDNSAVRVSWATLLTEEKLADGTPITTEAFRRKIVEEGLYVLDLTQGLKVGETYDGGLSVLENMAYKSDPQTISGASYAGYVAGTGNPKTAGSAAKGTVPDSGSVLKVTAQKDGKFRAAVKINAGKTIYFVDGTEPAFTQEYKNESSASEFTQVSYEVTAGHTYYFYGDGTKVPMYGITVDYREPEDWNNVAAPVLGTPVVKGGTIEVPFTASIGGKNADSLEVKMMLNGDVADVVSAANECEEGSVSFVPKASGTYIFKATLKRSGEIGKAGNETEGVDFILPMAKPVIINAENLGEGSIRFGWKDVPEAVYYNVYLDGAFVEKSESPVYRFAELTVGTEYTFGVEAVRGDDISEMASVKQTVTADSRKIWQFAAFGSGVDTKNNGAEGNIADGLTVFSKGGKGKLVPASTDGLAFYYTTIDPETENFTLSADVTVDEWTYSNGQEGFGLMAADAVGENGDSSVFWNNSYMASVTKVEYYWDKAAGKVSDAGDKYTMKLGIGSQEKIGATPENIAQENTVSEFSSKMTTLETSCPDQGLGEGTYNLAGNYTNKDVDMGDVNNLTTFHLTIQRNNTGYFISYTDPEGRTVTNKYYHGDEGDELTHVDANNIYVGFFASRNAEITVTNVSFTTVKPSEDKPAEVRPVVDVTPSYTIESAKYSNTGSYDLVYYGNADGILHVTGPDGKLADNVRVTAKKKVIMNTTLHRGTNEYKVSFTPDGDYKPSRYEKLSSYDRKEFTFTVTYEKYRGDLIYVSPDGSASGSGEKNSPMDIYSAVKYVSPGQKILLTEGTYELGRTLTIDRGIDGTKDSMIYMMADPEAAARPVLDFGRKCAGLVIAADYWYFQGFDVTNSSNGQKGIQVSGSYNVLDRLMAYKNGNTGIQISRYKSTDSWEDWPSNNLILNCTSYLNADAGYEDADGFAAKLTIADGNVFDGCIAAYNADDGWDLFAKVESGPIGQVVIRNCVAFKNGYVIDANGNDKSAGNGNGFKLGGSSITGYHRLENSISFANKAKGIDSNSCPDIQVYNSTSYNNESYNVAFYTSDTKNTDFNAEGVLSYKDVNKEPEQIKLKGNQDENKVYRVSNYYFNGVLSLNVKKAKASADWFVNLDTEKAIHGGITRNADGTINMNGYLELTGKAPADTGARMGGTASGAGDATERTPEKMLEDALNRLASLTADTSNKEEVIVEALDLVERTRYESVTLNSVQELNLLEQIEKKLKELTGSEVHISLEAEALQATDIYGAALSLPVGAKGVLQVAKVILSQNMVDTYLGGGKAEGVAFDLKLLSENREYQLKVPVRIGFTLPEGMTLTETTLLLHIKDDNTWENLPYVVTEGSIYFLTDSFSTFIFANSGKKDDSGSGEDGGNNNGGDNNNGGNNNGGENNDSGNHDNGSGNDGKSDEDSGSDHTTGNKAGGSVRKSPATYDSSAFMPGRRPADNSQGENPEYGGNREGQDGASGVTVAAAAGRLSGLGGSGWILALVIAVSCIAGLAGGVFAYRRSKKEED